MRKHIIEHNIKISFIYQFSIKYILLLMMLIIIDKKSNLINKQVIHHSVALDLLNISNFVCSRKDIIIHAFHLLFSFYLSHPFLIGLPLLLLSNSVFSVSFLSLLNVAK